MRIDTILNIIDGELVNCGFISEISGFADNLTELKRAYLFISDDDNKIREAIKNGAYAILSTQYHPIIDDEIAWIRVDNIEKALLKLLKYKLLNKTLYFCNKITLEIIKNISNSEIATIDKIEAKYLNDYDYFITFDKRLANLSINSIPLTKKEKIELIDSTLFISKFKYKNILYKVLFPSLYLDELSIALGFFEKNGLEYNLKNLQLSRLIPQFVNKNNEKIPFGKSDRVVVKGVKNDEFLTRELNFIFEKAKYGVVKFYDKNNIEFFYKNYYNFAILIDIDVELKEKEDNQEKLF